MVLLNSLARDVLLTLPAILAGIAAVITAWRVGRKVDAVHELANSRLGELVALTDSAARAEGRLEGVQESQARVDDPPLGSPGSSPAPG